MILEIAEVNILRELRARNHAGWLTSAEIAERLDIPGWKVRAILNDLKHRFLVKRGNVSLGHWGEFSITENGLIELARADQMRLVR